MPWNVRSMFSSQRRHTSSGLHTGKPDGLRFIAIAFVYLYHLAGDVARHTPAGSPSVLSPLCFFTHKLNIGVPFFCGQRNDSGAGHYTGGSISTHGKTTAARTMHAAIAALLNQVFRTAKTNARTGAGI
jgi:hypothetical protein